MTDKEQKKKNITNSKKPNTFLFSGYFVDGIQKGKVSPIQNALILTKDPKTVSNEDIINGKAPYLSTDDKGGLYHFSHQIEKDFRLRQPFKTIKKIKQSEANELTVIIPPTDLVCLNALLEKDWLQTLNTAMQKIQLADGGEFPKTTLHKVTKQQLREPRLDMINHEVDRGYRTWYNKLKKTQEINCYILPKTRAVFFLFTMPIINKGTKLELIIPGQKKPEYPEIISVEQLVKESGQKADNNPALYIATHTGTEVELPKGMYTFTVSKPLTSKNAWSEKVTGNKDKKIEGDNSYSLSVCIDFAIENHAGEFSIINADPISIEESLITQHPQYYAHLTQNALLQTYPQHSTEDSKSEDETQGGLQALYNQWNNTKTAAEFGLKTLGCQSNSQLLSLLSKALHEKISDREDKKIAETIDLYFDITATAKAWSSFRKSQLKLFELLIGKETKNFALATKVVGAASRKELINASKKGVVENFKKGFWSKDAWLKTEDFEKTIAAKLKIPEKGFSFLGKAISIADIIASGVSVANAFVDSSNANTELRFAIDDLRKLSQQYLELVGEQKLKITTVLRTEFDFDKTDIKPEFEKHLQKDILQVLNEYPHKTITLEGHTDSTGTVQYNKELSEHRTEAIKKWLVANGIAENRINTIGHGEKKPETSNSSSKGRAKNRRVVAEIVTDESYCGAPCRIGMNNLERFRGISVQKQLDSDAAALAAGEKLLDCALAILSVIPITAPFALAISLAKAAIKTAEDFDKWLLGGAIAKAVASDKVYGELVLESLANQSLLHKLTFKNDKFSEEKDKEIAHFRLRAEAIAGLVRLLIRASIALDGDETIEQKIKHYKISQYIHNFILNDDWIYPISSTIPLGMDEFWLFAINENNLDHEKAKEGFGFDNSFYSLAKVELQRSFDIDEIKLELKKDNLKHDSSLFFHMMSRIQSDLPGHIRTDFQKKYPIHFMASKEINEFAKQFNPSFDHLDDESYEFTAIYFQKYKPTIEAEKDKWFSMAHYQVDNTDYLFDGYALDSYIPISPLDKIKILLVFKDQGDNKVDKVTPVNVHLFRRDGLDAVGPKYKSLARPLCMSDFDGLTHMSKEQKLAFVGKYGCIIRPFYQLGSDTFYGTKPLASSVSFWWKDDAYEYYTDGCLTNMKYGFECIIGNNEFTKIDIPLTSKKHWNYKSHYPIKFATEYLVDLNYDKGETKKPEEEIFLNKSFLTSNSNNIERTKLFDGQINLSSWVRFGGLSDHNAPYLPARAGSVPKKVLAYYSSKGINIDQRTIGPHYKINGFNWNTSVEFIFIIICTQLHKEEYLKQKIDWQNISGNIQLCEDGDNFDSDLNGPLIKNLNFNYICTLPQGKDRSPVISQNISDKNLLPIVDNLKSSNQKGKQLLGLMGCFVDERILNNQEHFIYAAHVKMEYTSPTGIQVDGIRPFGDDKIASNGKPKDDYFEYSFKNFSTISESGIKNSSISTKYDFQSPKNFNANTPWVKQGESIPTERLKRWFENESTAINAMDNDVRKKNAGK